MGIANPGENPGFDKRLGSNKTFMAVEDSVIDKLMARKDIERLYILQKQAKLSKEQLNELLHLLTAVEPKFLNFDAWLHYAMTHFLVGVRRFIGMTLQFHSIDEKIKEAEKEGKIVTQRTKELFDLSFLEVESQMKFVLDIFCYAGRASMSRGALAFKEFVRAQWEYEYGQRMKNVGFLERTLPQGLMKAT